MSDLPDKQAIHTVLRGCSHYWHMLGGLPGNENHSAGNLRWMSGHFAKDYAVTYSVLPEGPDYDREIREIVQKAQTGGIPGNMVLIPELFDADIIAMFRRYGDCEIDTDSGMAKDLQFAQDFTAPPRKLALYPVRDVTHLKIAASLLNAAFDYDFFSLGHYADLFHTPGVYFYTAEWDGIPVGACMALHGDDFVEIAWVGTLTPYRGRGIAGYLMNMAEREAAADGKRLSVLSAFPGAVNAYLRAGYQRCCDVVTIRLKG